MTKLVQLAYETRIHGPLLRFLAKMSFKGINHHFSDFFKSSIIDWLTIVNAGNLYGRPDHIYVNFVPSDPLKMEGSLIN